MNKCKLTCDFCLEFTEQKDHPDRNIASFRNEFVLLSTLGCFREGYCLYMPLSHERSFASMNVQQLIQVEAELEEIRQLISQEYSTNVILAEHGPGLTDMGASCCDHAHIHVIPVRSPRVVFLEFYNTQNKLNVLNNYSDLTTYHESAYIYLSCGPGQHFVWENASSFGRQYVRRVCAELEGVGPMFNWRLYPFTENMERTTMRLRRRFHENSVSVQYGESCVA
jgi:diadenosine tetraphosphate (Ap4A) HIT family hydrolase